MSEPTVFIVDDNPSVLKSLRALLQSAGLAVETYTSADEFLAAYAPERPGCLVLDIRLGRESGLDLQELLHRRNSILPILVLTGHATVAASVRAMKAGAVDFLKKPAPPELILERIHAALERDRQQRAVAAESTDVMQRMAQLTPREREVMDLLLEGKTSKEIAAAMQVSVRTVEGHRRMVFLKMDVSSAAQLVRTVLAAQKPLPPG